MLERFNKLINLISDFTITHPRKILIGIFIITAIATYGTLKLELKSNFETMLPDHFQSVKDLKKYQNRVGGTSYLSIGLESKDIGALKRFAEDIVKEIERNLSDKIIYIEYNVSEVQNFYEKYGILYLPLTDLKDAYTHLKSYIDKKKLEASGLFVDLEAETEDKKDPLNFIKQKIEKYKDKAAERYKDNPDGYFLKVEKNKKSLLAILIRPTASATGIKESKKLINEVKEVIEHLNPQKYSSDMEYGFAGPIQITLDEYETIKKDIFKTAGLCIILIVTSILLYFLRLRSVLLLGLSLIIGISWTLGLTYLTIGYLNTQTGFLASIIMGTSINYGIIWLARYIEERNKGNSPPQSIIVTNLTTWQATLAACITTAVAFGSLMLSKNKSFVQFGFIASVGLIINWLIVLLLLPSSLLLLEQYLPIHSKFRKGLTYGRIVKIVGKFITNSPYVTFGIIIITLIFSWWKIIKFLPNCFEEDLSRLRNKMTFHSGTAELDHKISQIIGMSTATATILTDSLDEAKQLCKVLEEKRKRFPEKYGYENCRTILDFLPDHQEEKLNYINKIKELIAKNRKYIPAKYKRMVNEMENNLSHITRPLTIKDLPEKLIFPFKEITGEIGKIVYVSPIKRKDIWFYPNLKRFVETIKENQLPNGKKITTTGGPIIMYDLLQLVIHDSPRTTIYAILLVFLTIWIILKDFKSALITISSLLAGISLMGGFMAILGIKVNFFNFIAIPTAFGTAADYSINILHRFNIEKNHNSNPKEILIKALSTTGGAVFLCSLTTIIGYWVLTLSNSQALSSYGWIAIGSEISCLSMAICFVPSFLLILKK